MMTKVLATTTAWIETDEGIQDLQRLFRHSKFDLLVGTFAYLAEEDAIDPVKKVNIKIVIEDADD